MNIKLVAMLIVIAAALSSTELIAHGQPSNPPGKKSLGLTFSDTVGRDATPQELAFWKNAQRGNQIKSLDVPIGVLIMDWFVAPAQMKERLAAINQAYNYYFKRTASAEERVKAEALVTTQRIPYINFLNLIRADLAITDVHDVAGDPHAVNVTIKNLSAFSTSVKGSVGVRIFQGRDDCSLADGTPLVDKWVFVPLIPPQQSVTVKLTSTKILQRANAQRSAYQLDMGFENFDTNYENSTRCVSRVKFSTDKVIDQTPNIQVQRNQPAVHGTLSPPKKP